LASVFCGLGGNVFGVQFIDICVAGEESDRVGEEHVVCGQLIEVWCIGEEIVQPGEEGQGYEDGLDNAVSFRSMT